MNLLKGSKIDLNSAAIGILLCLVVTLLLAATDDYSYFQRYECCTSSGDASAVFVIDTFTGQTWRLDIDGTIDYGKPYEHD